MTRSARAAAAALSALLVAMASAAADEPPAPEASGALSWIDSDKLDLVGVLAARVPVATCGPYEAVVDASAVTAIRKTTAEATFLVEQVGYRLELGARRSLPDRGAVTFGVEERGAVLVDAAGRARVRLVTAGWETQGARLAVGPSGWSGGIEGGVAISHDAVDVTGSLGGRVRWLHPVGSLLVGVDGDADALLGVDRGADVSAGALAELPLGGDRRLGLTLRWLHGRNPLGLLTDGVMAGFDVTQGIAAPAARPVPPEVSGLVAGGGGDASALARLLVRVASAPFLQGTFVAAEVDANVLTASTGNELFYLYDAGVAHPVGRLIAGGWFYHRSNHLLDHPNDTVTSINVFEGGIETPGYGKAEPGLPLGAAGGLDARLRAGWLASSAFGEDVRYNVRGGLRWSSPDLSPDVRLYVAFEFESGDADRAIAAIGTSLPRGWDVRIETRHEEQLFGREDRSLMGVATLYF
ncbi:MAG TPA: hypothetical protein VMR65_08405 [Candidatus Sulfotelmatobacter sp.]|jgi:hypothetical protein|nr:hypothetical protein [Candidatus Sulfotelmatobacter sp.]